MINLKRYGFQKDYYFADGKLKDIAVKCGWRRLPTDTSFYSVYLSASGDAVKTQKIGKPKYLTPTINANGYRTIKLKQPDGSWRTYAIYQLVARMFCDGSNRPGVRIPHHIDGDKMNDHYLNLLWCTDKEHGLLHRLFKTDEEAYHQYVSSLQELNAQWAKWHIAEDTEATA